MKSLGKLAIGAVLVLGTGSLLFAQPGDPPDHDSDFTVSGQKPAVMSPAEMTVASVDLMHAMNGHLRHVTQLREKAQAEKDIIKVNCLSDKLIPMKAQLNLAEGSKRILDERVGAGDDSGRYAAYGDLVISNDKMKDLREEADACVGDALTYVGETDVQVTGPDNPLIPVSGGLGVGIEPPAYKTPFD